MKKILIGLVLLMMLGVPLAPVLAAETVQTCIDDLPVLPTRSAECIGVISSADQLPLDASSCAKILAANAVTIVLPTPAIKYLALKCVGAGYTTAKQSLCDHGPGGVETCCMSSMESPKIAIAEGACTNEKQTCEGQSDTLFSCCVCLIDGKVAQEISQSRDTRTTCQDKCKAKGWSMDTSLGAGTLPAPKNPNAPSVDKLAQIDAMCFTQADCAGPDYGQSASAFRPGNQCPPGKGRCVAPEPTVTLSYPIGGVKTVQGYRDFVLKIFNFLIGAVATVAAVAFVYGGFRYIFGAAFSDVDRGKEIMIDAVVGLVLVLGSYTLLQTFNPATLNFNKLEVFMINKQIKIDTDFCVDLKKVTGGAPTFADAGNPPDLTPPDKIASFPLAAEETVCDHVYYPEGLGANTCKGRSCQQLGPGNSCVTCANSQGKIPECGSKTTGYVCIKAQWSGNMTWSDSKKPNSILPIVVCNNAQNTQDFKIVQANMYPVRAPWKILALAQTGDSTGVEKVLGSGSAPYRIEIPAGADTDATAKCANGGGGVKGILLSVQYPTDGEALILRNNCGSAGRFAGYESRKRTAINAYENAFWCNTQRSPNAPLGTDMPLIVPAQYWSVDDLKAALDGTHPIQCDIQIDKANAPDAPDYAINLGNCPPTK